MHDYVMAITETTAAGFGIAWTFNSDFNIWKSDDGKFVIEPFRGRFHVADAHGDLSVALADSATLAFAMVAASRIAR